MRDWRHDHLLDLRGSSGHSEHPGHGVAVDVGVQQAHFLARGGEGGREVDGDRRLADAALAASDRVNLGQRGVAGEWDLAFWLAAAQLAREFLALLLAHHVELDLDGAHPRQLSDGRLYIPLNRFSLPPAPTVNEHT